MNARKMDLTTGSIPKKLLLFALPIIYSSLVNLVLNVVLVVGCGLGVEGIAIGTIASQFVFAMWMVTILFNPKGEYRMSVKKLLINQNDALSLVKIAIPTAINNTVFGFSNILI